MRKNKQTPICSGAGHMYSAYGLYINISLDDKIDILSVSDAYADHKAEVAVVVCGVKKEFSFKDFLHRLGFDEKEK